MEHLDRIAEGYEGLLGDTLQEQSRKRINWICGQVQGSTVLDIGCSQGICEVLLGRRGFRVTGIDCAPESITYAKKLIDQESSDVKTRVQLLCADFIKEVELTDQYDTVLLTEILEHLENPKEMVKKAAESLKIGGEMIVTVPFGINDFPDHKQTFYMADISEIFSEWVQIDHVEYMSDWIGFCCTKADCANSIEKIDASLVLQEEKMFFALERPLRDKLKSLLERSQKLKSDYETMKTWYEEEKEKRKGQEKQTQDQQKRTAEARQAANRIKSDYETMKIWYETEKGKRREQEQQAAKTRKDIRELRAQYESVRQEYEKLQKANAKLLKERDMYFQKYHSLAHAKLGKLNLKYWEMKNRFSGNIS